MGYISFVYNGASITSGFSPISQKLCYLQICMIYHEKGFSYSAYTHVCYIKIHAEMTEILQVKDCSCYIHWCS